MLSFSKLAFASAAAVLLGAPLSANAAPLAGAHAGPAAQNQVSKAQFGIYFGYGRPSYYDRPYYRPYYYSAPPAYYYNPPAGADYEDDAVARCASQFRSFDVRTGTYTTYEGEVRLCPYLR